MLLVNQAAARQNNGLWQVAAAPPGGGRGGDVAGFVGHTVACTGTGALYVCTAVSPSSGESTYERMGGTPLLDAANAVTAANRISFTPPPKKKECERDNGDVSSFLDGTR